MSRIGKRPITIPEDVTVEVTATKIEATSGANKQSVKLLPGFKVEKTDTTIVINRPDDTITSKARHGLIARLTANMLIGVKDGFTKELEFNGTGYRVAVNANEVLLNMGYSHEINLAIPDGITVVVKKNQISVSGVDKQKVGQFAARIREVRKPEVYKGKGIKYKDELIKRKAGKKAASA